MSYDSLARDFPGYTKDFSIIEDRRNDRSISRLLAEYVEPPFAEALIAFTTDRDRIWLHDQAFNDIKVAAVRVTHESTLESIARQVFPDQVGRPVEMSAYIPIEEYDEHELEHAYYREMMAEMIEAIRSGYVGTTGTIRILEVGAGTGIFTRQLAENLKDAEIVAVELDWKCHARLVQNVRGYKCVTPLRADSCSYRTKEQFDFVVSSFADHHIHPSRKREYFEGVASNLRSGGQFIVGDEFLRAHEVGDRGARAAALQDYHGHIIGEAIRNGHPVLAELERKALQSGLLEMGDFKLTCDQYRDLARQSGMTIVVETKIGPNRPGLDVGGVYVYVLRVA